MFFRGLGLGMMVVAGALVSGAALSDAISNSPAQTASSAPTLYAAPADAFPARVDVGGDQTQKPESVVVSQIEPVSGPLAPVAVAVPAPRPAVIAVDRKPVAHARHSKQRVAYLDRRNSAAPKAHGPSFMIGVGY